MATSILIYGECLKQSDIKPHHKDIKCAICFENIASIKQYHATKCGHCFCDDCIMMWTMNQYKLGYSSRSCPLCRQNIKNDMIIISFVVSIEHNLQKLHSITFKKKLFNHISKTYNLDHNKPFWIDYEILKIPSKDDENLIPKLLHMTFIHE